MRAGVPWNTLKLADLGDRVASGTYFIARRALARCAGPPCVKACPTGALDHRLVDINKAKMGTAVLVDEENCLNFLGLPVRRLLPRLSGDRQGVDAGDGINPRTRKHAIFRPTVQPDRLHRLRGNAKSCVLEEAAIKVLPLKVARGESTRHYRLGWKESTKHQGPLVGSIVDLPDRSAGRRHPALRRARRPPIIDPTKLGRWKP